MIFADFDMKILEVRCAQFVEASGMEGSAAMKRQTGAMINVLVKNSSPKKLASALKKSARDVKQVFRVMPKKVFKGKKGDGELQWLYAAKSGFLIGADHEDVKEISVQGMREYYNGHQMGANWRGPAWERLGDRGKFKVFKINRRFVSRADMAAFLKDLLARTGKLKASFAIGWKDIQSGGMTIYIPGYVAAHLQAGDAKGDFVNHLDNKENPTATIISRSPGCESNNSRRVIKQAAIERAKAIEIDCTLYVKGIKKKVGFE